MIELFNFLFLKNFYLHLLFLGQQKLHERRNLFDHAERKELIDISIRSLNHVVEVFIAVCKMSARFLCLFDELNEVLFRCEAR